ncbi:DegT/DnrJ/EryC1/StrS family aminotransferase [Alicyclobacillus ferrooxydans]|uniref:Polysaccharide biosynthesis protein n=1 Tax=Alicyclobacillus ferrooxydans TaxID=471514 RepID=A0A0P9GT99_9BACL|nr:DegT/DnrJ/EryC1/StrS family aminotransferase [Alicyclobacillus ferrooxydans]KPV44374.1 polysaccharide biosynthesis protein [Alicyclobacillus ferrooxydans]
MQIPLSSPDINQCDKEAVMSVLNTSVLSIGRQLKEFESLIADSVGVKHGIGVNSGTSGLHVIIRALGISDGDEVITTPFSFVSSANCILFERAKPVFVDIDPITLNIDPAQIEEKITPKTKAILGVHVFGHPYDIDTIHDIARRHGLYVIEDACEAIGAKYHGRTVGAESDAAVFAFYPNKQITTGEGGMIVTNHEELARLARSLRNQGRSDTNEWLSHERLGYNYRLSEMNAALGVSQFSRLNKILSKRAEVANKYTKLFHGADQIITPQQAEDIEKSWFVYVIQLADGLDRNLVMEALQADGIGCRGYFSPIHLQPFYREQFGFQEGDFPITESVSARTIALPFFTSMSDDQVEYVVDRVCSITENM